MHCLLNVNKLQKPGSFLDSFTAIKCVCWSFWAFLEWPKWRISLPFHILHPHKQVFLDKISSFLQFFFMFFTLHEEVLLTRETFKETMFVTKIDDKKSENYRAIKENPFLLWTWIVFQSRSTWVFTVMRKWIPLIAFCLSRSSNWAGEILLAAEDTKWSSNVKSSDPAPMEAYRG